MAWPTSEAGLTALNWRVNLLALAEWASREPSGRSPFLC